jgi:hypothetical protein
MPPRLELSGESIDGNFHASDVRQKGRCEQAYFQGLSFHILAENTKHTLPRRPFFPAGIRMT